MIGKTRHDGAMLMDSGIAADVAVFARGCGVLKHSPSPGTYRHERFAPPGVLRDWVQHFWIESWDVRGSGPQIREVLPHPCVHYVITPGYSRIYGVQLRRFVRTLEGNACLVGIKFRPGAFYPFLRRPIASIANSFLPASPIFSGTAQIERDVFDCRGDEEKIEVASQWLTTHLPPMDPLVNTACILVESIANDPGILRVRDLVSRSGLSNRTLQRVFRRYVGASASWVIKRYRLYEALQQLTDAGREDLATLAQQLGYFDQAHFINDFRRFVGRSPTAYLRM